MPTPPTPDELRAERDRLLEQGQAALLAGRPAEAGELFFQAQVRHEAAQLLEARLAEREGLPRTETARTVVPMDAAARELKIGAARIGDHPFPRALYKRHMTVGEWAEKMKLSREKVSSWWKTGPGGRRIPREWADRIRDEFGIPHSAWPNGVK